MRVIAAQHLWAAPGRVFSPGEVHVDGCGRIVAVGRARGGRIQPWLLVPGLVNAHVHLQLPAVPAAPSDFVGWLGSVIQTRREPGAEHAAVARTMQSLDDLVRTGCTAVAEIDSLGTSPAILRAAGVAGRCYQEVVGFDLGASAARALVHERQHPGSSTCASGLSPHAPYSCSMALVRAARRASTHITVHVAEADAELQLLRDGSGPLRTLLEGLGKWPRAHVPPAQSPVEWLAAGGALDRRTLLVHLQAASARDLEIVRARRAPVVVCPATLTYFGRTPPDVPTWLRSGIPVALGTDSLASSRVGLSMVAAMAGARTMWPALSPAIVLAMATRLAALAIGRPSLGRIAVGGRADLCAFELARPLSLPEAVDAATRGSLPVRGTWLCGHARPASPRTEDGLAPQ